MRFELNGQALLDTLPIMFYGVLGGMFVMVLLCFVLFLLYRVPKWKRNKEENG